MIETSLSRSKWLWMMVLLSSVKRLWDLREAAVQTCVYTFYFLKNW